MNRSQMDQVTVKLALRYLRAGLSVIPVHPVEKTPLLKEWKKYSVKLPTKSEVREWFSKPDRSIAIICGGVSGNAETIDFDQKAVLYKQWKKLVEAECPGLVKRLLCQKTQRDGKHASYRCKDKIDGNLKLAQRPKPENPKIPEVLIETRGEGGYFLATPSAGYKLFRGEFTKLPLLMKKERNILLRAARALNTYVDPKKLITGIPTAPRKPGEPQRPGDAFNERGDIRPMLEECGWKCVKTSEKFEHWRRPGKEDGQSASLIEGKVFNVFSTNGYPFEGGNHYSLFAAFALLKHSGDFKTAAVALAKMGYGEKDGKNEKSKLVVARASNIKREAIRHLWPNRFARGKISVIAGDPGLGKSYVSLDMAARVSAGMKWPDLPKKKNREGEVIVISAEDGAGDTIRPRLEYMHAYLKRVFIVSGVTRNSQSTELPFSLEADIPALEKHLKKHSRVRLVVIDPINAFLGSTDSHKNSDVRAVLAPLGKLAEKYRVAVVVIHHLNKAQNTKAMYRLSGSLAFGATARVVWLIVKDGDDSERRLMLCAKNNLSKEATGLAFRIKNNRVRWEDKPVIESVEEALARDTDSGRASKITDAEEFLKRVLKDGPVLRTSVQQQATDAGISGRTLERAKAKLRIKAKKEGFGAGASWRWSLRKPVLGTKTAKKPPTPEVADLAKSAGPNADDSSQVSKTAKKSKDRQRSRIGPSGGLKPHKKRKPKPESFSF